ncbi:MAG: hypothetical protein M0R03_22675 [Novosphingobium sp.]|nr:hypothetical protein [Novosphingobium sp.]
MSESIFLTKEMLLEQKDALAIEKVELKDSKGNVRGHVFVREMTAKEKNTWELSLTKVLPKVGRQQQETVMNLEDYRVKLAICTICDEQGTRLFDMKPNVIATLSERISASNMERIADKASELNKITKEDQEELVKNLETDRIDSSNSDSV